MLNTVVKKLKHATRLVQNAVRDLHVRRRRSRRWHFVKNMHLAMEPTCQACGCETRVQVHHVEPYHLNPERELDLGNLITLCMGPNECHLWVGHGGDYKAFNKNVQGDSWELLEARRRGDRAGEARMLKSIHQSRSYALVVRQATAVGESPTLH